MNEVSITFDGCRRSYEVRKESTADLVLWLLKRPWVGCVQVRLGQ